MTEKQFRESVSAVKFYVQKKESFSIEDIYAIEEQVKNKVISELGRNIENEEIAYKAQILDLTGKVNSFDENGKTQVDKFEETEKNLITQLEEFKAKFEKAEESLKGFKVKETKAVAVELLKGLVATGAELDVYQTLNDAIKEVEFDEGETLESRQSKVKPIIDGYIETKPYLSPESIKNRTDNKGLITKTKTTITGELKGVDGEDVAPTSLRYNPTG